MTNRTPRPVPEMKGSTLISVGDNHFVDSVTGMVLSRVGRVHPTLGYERVKHNGRDEYVHRLVFEAIVGEIPMDKTINHWDGDKENNRPDNLELATPSEQMLHSWMLGNRSGKGWVGEKNGNSSLSNAEADEIRTTYSGNPLQSSEKYGVSRSTIYNILRGRTYKM